jgi:hypothetical protein
MKNIIASAAIAAGLFAVAPQAHAALGPQEFENWYSNLVNGAATHGIRTDQGCGESALGDQACYHHMDFTHNGVTYHLGNYVWSNGSFTHSICIGKGSSNAWRCVRTFEGLPKMDGVRRPAFCGAIKLGFARKLQLPSLSRARRPSDRFRV